MNSYGWRIPFLLAGVLGLVGLYIRLRLSDTPEFEKLRDAGEVAKSPLKKRRSTSCDALVSADRAHIGTAADRLPCSVAGRTHLVWGWGHDSGYRPIALQTNSILGTAVGARSDSKRGDGCCFHVSDGASPAEISCRRSGADRHRDPHRAEQPATANPLLRLGGEAEVWVGSYAHRDRRYRPAWPGPSHVVGNVGLPLRDVYGQTEVSGATSMTRPMGSLRGGVGRPLPGVEVKVADDGELLVRSPSVFTRYVGDEQKTADAFDSGWFKTGDRARLTDSGDLVLQGRVQSQIRTPGGDVADLTDLTRRITSALGASDVAYHRDESGVYLYVAVHPEGIPRHVLIEEGTLDPLPPADPAANVVKTLLDAFPGKDAIVGVALFRGGFGYRDGEVGPTGKSRGWRIHQVRGAWRARAPSNICVSPRDDARCQPRAGVVIQ